MATYLELKAQAEKLMAEAEAMRQKEVDDAIADIKSKIKAYGITSRDLGLHLGSGAGMGAPRRPRNAGKVVKYRGPNGETWGGGRGRKPDWVIRALKDGHQLEEFAV